MTPLHIDDPEGFNQKIDYSDIAYGRIRPTDIDGFIEYHNKLFIFMEFKCEGVDFFGDQHIGQRLALERLVDSLYEVGKSAYVIIATHPKDYTKDLKTADCKVIKVRMEKQWREPSITINLKDYIDILVKGNFEVT